RAAELAGATLVNASGRVGVSHDPGCETGDRFPGADSPGGLAALAESARASRSLRYPFALIAAA
ncbi:MAG: hypothetical protein QM606_07350, partial [Leucobacter sp.]